jgi:putative ABC transport system permease protein
MVTSSVILIFVMAGLIIQNAALTSAKTASDSVGSTVTLSVNREKMFSEMRSSQSSSEGSETAKPTITMPTTTVAKVNKIGALSNVSAYNITNSASVNASGFTAVTTTTSSTESEHGGFGGGMGQENSATSGDISISGTTATAGADAFKAGTAKITSGRGIKASDIDTNNVVIESELAISNSLKVGDKIKVADVSDSNKTTELTIVGIYKTTATEGGGMSRVDPSNVIYSSYTLANTLAGTVDQVSNVTFTMAEPSKTTAFLKSAKKVLNDSKMSLTSDKASYEKAASQMKSTAVFASKIVWVVAIAGALILGLIILLITRERRREIGILVSLGESKIKVVGQLFVELLVVLVIALGVATAAGTTVSNVVGTKLVEQQTASLQQAAQTGAQGGGFPGGGKPSEGGAPAEGAARGGMRGEAVATTATEKLKNVLTPSAVVELGGVAVLIALVSVMGGAVMILKLRPKQILQAD